MVVYDCSTCNFSTHIKTHYNKHLNTTKHKKAILNIKDPPPIGEKSYIFHSQPLTNPHKLAKNPSQNLTKPHKSSQNIANLNLKELSSKKTLFVCNLCSKTFTRYDNLNRHKSKFCKRKTSNNDEYKSLFNEYRAELEKQKEESKKSLIEANITIKNLCNHIDKLVERVGTTNITQNNIVLNSYGNEDLSHISNEYKSALLRIPFGMIPKMIEKVHFNSDKPENNNILMSNKKDRYLKVYQMDKWVYTDKKSIIKKLIDDNFHILDSHYNELNGVSLNNDQNARYKDFQIKKELENMKLENEISKETEILILNKSK